MCHSDPSTAPNCGQSRRDRRNRDDSSRVGFETPRFRAYAVPDPLLLADARIADYCWRSVSTYFTLCGLRGSAAGMFTNGSLYDFECPLPD